LKAKFRCRLPERAQAETYSHEARAMVFDQTYYQSQYRDYSRQTPRRKLDFYRRMIVWGAGGRARRRILDIGCAFGHFLASLGDEWERSGEDASKYAIDKARSANPHIRFELSQTGTHPIKGPFDAITAFDVLEHMDGLREELSWIHGNLIPGGIFAFVVPVYDGPTGPIIRMLDRDPTHLHKWERRRWLDLVSERFQVLDWWGIFRYLIPGGPYVHVTTHALRVFTPAIACLTKRP
jgi:SAM-dependent methyltransferase